tara:strand:- start:636 stop:917 length:282 start_codon:yes stop_codon:yes gene_type:complete
MNNVLNEWKTYYKDLDIPENWKNVSYSNDELPSFLDGNYIIYIKPPNSENRFHIMSQDEDEPPFSQNCDTFDDVKYALKLLNKSKDNLVKKSD